MPRMPNIYLEAQYQQRLWTPAVLRPSGWYDFSDLRTIATDANGINQITDKSGSARNFTQTNSANKPTPREIPNGNWSGDWGASGKALASSSNFAAGAKTIFACYKFSGFPAGNAVQILNIKDISANTWFEYALLNIGGYQPRHFADGIQVTQITSRGVADAASTNPEIAAITYDGVSNTANSSYAYRLDGAAKTVVASGLSGRLSATELSGLGARVNSSLVPIQSVEFNGSVYEAIVFVGSALSTFDLQRVEGYLSWKWGIRLAADHPFANRPPLIGD